MEALIYILLAGMLGGAVRSVVRYAAKDESFDVDKFIKSLIIAAVGGLVLAYTLGLGLVATFFAALSTDVVLTDLYKKITK